jgi:hypothetical protein
MSHVKNTILLSILLSVSFATVRAQQQPATAAAPNDSTTWITYAPAGAGFKVLMPSKPSETAMPVQGRQDLENHVITLDTPLGGYVVSYVQFPDDVTDPRAIKEMLDRGREGGLASTKGELKNEKEISLNGFSGREWKMEIPGGIVAIARAYWVKRRLYQTVFVTAPKSDDSPELIKFRQEAGSKFLDSFALMDVGK